MNEDGFYQCNYYDSKEDGNFKYYSNTNVYDSVADAMIEAANTATNIVEKSNLPVDVRIMNWEEIEE